MKMWNVFPEGKSVNRCQLLMFAVGLFLDNAIAIASKELHWETDYIREASCMDKFRSSMEILYHLLSVI